MVNLSSDEPSGSLELVVLREDLGTLTTNAKAILEAVKLKCSGYKLENYGPDNISVAKRDKADLNALAAKINSERLTRERKFMEPFNEFKDLANEIVGEVKKASGLIDSVVKEVEAKEKADKRAELETFFDEQKTEMVSFEKIFKPAWLNKGTSILDAQKDIKDAIKKVFADMTMIDRLPAEDKNAVKAFYLDTLSIEKAFEQADILQANRDKLAKLEANKSEAKQPAFVEQIKRPVEVVEEPPVSSYDTETVEEKDAPMHEETMVRTFRVECTMEKLVALSSYMNANGITFEKV